jgi:anaerobic ribonucleoside-triphosphate reductase activating protein
MVRKLSGNMRIRVHRFLPVTEAEGPGQRAALWVQGCPIRCPGCFNRQTWSFRKGCWRTVGDLFRQIAEHPGLEGVTFTGGEPFAQARPLAALGRACRDAGLSVVTYTGYNYGRVRRSKRRDWKALLDVTDLLLAGPFVKELVDSSRPWVGSSNQEFVFLTDKYCHLNENCAPSPNNLEVRIDKLSGLSLNGTAPESDIKAIR